MTFQNICIVNDILSIFLVFTRCLKFRIKVMRKRPQRVGGTQNGKTGFDSSSYAEFYQEHDWHLSFNVWWPHDE